MCACVSLGGNIAKHDTGRLDTIVKKASSSVGMILDSLLVMAERRMSNKTYNNNTVLYSANSRMADRSVAQEIY